MDKDTPITAEEYKNLLKKNAKLEEKIEILKKLWAYSQGNKFYI
ncbi:hypothetical protein ACXATD_003245 [Clostridium sporogenes]|nr:hypothetical protein [Clostridium botulinum]